MSGRPIHRMDRASFVVRAWCCEGEFRCCGHILGGQNVLLRRATDLCACVKKALYFLLFQLGILCIGIFMRRVSTHKHSTKQWLLAVLLCLILWGAPIGQIYAQAPPDSGALPQTNSTSVGGMLWVYLGALVLGVVGFGAYLLRRARPDLEEPMALISPQQPLLASPPPLPQAVSAKKRAFRESVRDSGRHASVEMDAHDEPAKPLFNTSGQGQQKICSTCRRTYASWMVICPVDATPLQNNPSITRKRKSHTSLDRMRCPACSRRYSTGATHCAFDGQKLVQDSVEAAAQAPRFYVCTHCGAHHDGPNHQPECCDAPELVTFDFTETQQPVMAMALTICPKCHRLGQVGQIHCAHDGSLLTPLTALERHALPHVGYGPRRSICNSCGETFGGGYSHCTFDGSPLRPLH